MHDLINDLATSVAWEFSFRFDGQKDVSDLNETFDKFRHFSLVGPRSASYRKLKELQRAKSLRTFLLMSVGWENEGFMDKVLAELLHELQFLRVLSVKDLTPGYYGFRSEGSRSITKVPQSIGSLKHLRYLNFSNTGITCLPEQVGNLYNLQSLLVHNCDKLSSLPETFANLLNLRHFDISRTPKVTKLPLGIAGLTSLQTLTKVIVEGANGFKISDLKGLSDLQGQLFIIGLDKVIDPTQAKDANLHQKKGLDILEMSWEYVFDDSRNESIEYEVLKELRPHPKLKILKIWSYMGKRFPNWVGDPSFDHLTELTLCGCKSTQLPTLGILRSLKELHVQGMNEVKSVGFEFLAPTNSFVGNAFPSLEVLEFDNMQSWQRWSIIIGGDHATPGSFHRLREISITRCPKLGEVSIGLIPSLPVLYIDECSEEVLRSMVGLSSSLVKLIMSSVKGLTQLHGEDLMHLGALEHLKILRCDEMRYLWERESEACKSLVSLQKLDVYYCKKLVSLAEKEVDFGISMESLKQVTFEYCHTLESYKCPNSVESLVIKDCNSMAFFTFSPEQEYPSSLTESIIIAFDNIQQFGFPQMSHLKSLQISGCKNLKSLPHEHFQSLTSLEEMCIRDCPSMNYSIPCGVWPPNLSKLTIGCLNKPMSEWGQQSFPTSVVELILYGENSGVLSFAVADNVRNITTTTPPSSSFLLPPSLVYLMLRDFKDVESFSEVLQHLPCLKELDIWNCPKIRDLKTTSGPLDYRSWVQD